jgi:hypothetical protein
MARSSPLRLLVAALVVAGCSTAGAVSDGSLGGDPGGGEPVHDVRAQMATDLAPSQIAGSTVPDPATPVPCSVDDLEFWTARVVPNRATVDVVIRIRNAGEVRCDADISRSPDIGPAIEPDVWLDPDGTADLIVGQRTSECATPSVVAAVDVAIGGDVVSVPSAVLTCGWWLTAFYPNDPVREGCELEALELAATPGAVVVRNGAVRPCAMGGIVEVDGQAVADRRPAGPSVLELMPGDVVAFGRRDAGTCDGSTRRVELIDEVAGLMIVDDVPCDVAFESRAGGPWFGSVDVYPVGSADDPVDPSAVIDALNPFDDGP